MIQPLVNVTHYFILPLPPPKKVNMYNSLGSAFLFGREEWVRGVGGLGIFVTGRYSL